MNQIKMGSFLKELRKEKGITQEELAEVMGVSARSVSRWENGNTVPDIDLLVELAEYYDVDLRDLLNGERRSLTMDGEVKETVLMAAQVSNDEVMRFIKRINILMSIASVCMIGFIVIEVNGWCESSLLAENVSSICLGVCIGVIFGGAFATSEYGRKVRSRKDRLLSKLMKKG